MTASVPPSVPQALAPNERRVQIDILRGIAVFGLIWSNLNAGFKAPATTADEVARWVLGVFGAGKWYTLFALLFGVTLAMQLSRADARGEPFAGRWVRRMFVLYAIGWVHAILFWPGDILRAYAVAGLVLLLFRRASARLALFAAVVALSLGASRQSLSVLATRVTGGDVAAVEQRERPTPAQEERRRAFGAAMAKGTYAELLEARLATFPREEVRRASPPAGPLNLIPLGYLGAFLIGLALGRRRVPQDPDGSRRLILGLMVLGAVIGLPLSTYLAGRPAWLQNSPVYWPLRSVAILSLGLGYMGGLLWLLRRGDWLARLRWFAPVGRLALTNYIAQTAFLTTIKYHYGLGLEPQLNSFACGLIALGFYVVQIGYSNWWVRRWRFGPVEWLWRSLTYGAAQPMRVVADPVAHNVSRAAA